MFNVKALTDTLSSMDLAGLQKYAALHKDDPYVMAMALSIANQKKQMQTVRWTPRTFSAQSKAAPRASAA